ncbi:MAG: DUF3313 domain-containing protein [Candidatus Abyssobacteria bacterium SURF_17]|uniref:DUF3313 domain-containing protein n=1 Tax=Candidatus Abyssobacteria bacterium SURF_17 TaxID=2093361 RepID=A0A419ERY9_9BACT|nr:MAG: DUF3313 domain-containing protein [Candidatus Abyssubacteria bacterium SURF_17]
MGNFKKAGVFVVASIVVASLFGGCASSKQARSVEAKGFLVDYSMLEKGKDDQALLRYRNPKADIAGYTKVMLDPVLIAKPDKATQEQMADLQKLATNYYVYLSTELGKDYSMVQTPGPGTLRIQAAITGAEKSNAVTNTVSSVVPIGMGVSLVKDFATGKPVGVGEATSEMKITDASTGELLGAAVDRRVGGKNPDGIIDTWDGADSAMEYWAKRLRYVLCLERGGIECVKP